VDLVGYDGGETLAAWVLRSYERNAFRHILHQVAKVIMEELIPEGFVHGDVHCRNVLVGKDQQISLVDFGWCTHGSFRMDEEERKEHEERVRNVFDVRHFQDSLEKLFMEELGLSTLWMIHRNDLFLFAGIYDQKRDPEEQEHQDT
jgi:predicted unusual protein kinase regulating ubiquinone biosynthesis (AarF/ABC1/UbiB family)